jgi:hypothetical protein
LDYAGKKIIMGIDVENMKQALADYLRIDPKKISVCSVSLNDPATFQELSTGGPR